MCRLYDRCVQAASIDTRAAAVPSTRLMAGYLATFIVLGMMLSINGPALSWLRDTTGVGIATSGLVLSSGSIGYIIGSFAAGRPFDRGGGHRLLFGAFAVGIAAVVVAGWVSSFALVVVIFAMLGAAAGVIDVGGNTLVVWSQPSASVGPALNALHLCFGIGALITPLLVARSIAWSDSLVWVAAVVAVGVLAVLVFLRGTVVPERRAAVADTTGVEPSRMPLALVCAFYFLYVGSEVTFLGWAPTFAEVEQLGGVNGPSLFATTFLAGFALGRVLGIVLARRISLVALVLGSCVVSVVTALALVLAGGSGVSVWVACGVLGAALGPQYPTMMAYADQRLRLSGSATSRLVAASGVGGLLLPLLTGWLLDRNGGQALPWATLVCLVATTAVALAVVVVVGRLAHDH